MSEKTASLGFTLLTDIDYADDLGVLDNNEESTDAISKYDRKAGRVDR